MSRDWADALSVRIYQSVVTDDKFQGIYGDDRAFAWYVRLLLAAKAVYPAPAFLPASLPRSARKALVEAGILLVTPNGHFTLSGLVKEMTEAPDPAQRAGGVVRAALAERDGGGRFVAGSPMPTGEIDDGRADIEAFVEVKRRPPTERQRQVLDDVLARHDVNGPTWAAKLILANPQDPIGAVISADRQWRSSRQAAEAAAERAAVARKRVREPWLDELGKAMRERRPDLYGEGLPEVKNVPAQAASAEDIR